MRKARTAKKEKKRASTRGSASIHKLFKSYEQYVNTQISKLEDILHLEDFYWKERRNWNPSASLVFEYYLEDLATKKNMAPTLTVKVVQLPPKPETKPESEEDEEDENLSDLKSAFENNGWD